jgi:CRP/FNR family cyclic AMP-dependent transcriptional regulator
MREIAELLEEIEVLRDLDPEYRELIAGCATNVVFSDGERLMTVGDPATEFFAIRRGEIAVELAPAMGPPLVIETMEAGQVVGWSWLFEPYITQFDVRARGPVGAISFDGACLRGKCEADHDLGYELMRRFAHLITSRLQATRIRLLDIYGSPGTGI